MFGIARKKANKRAKSCRADYTRRDSITTACQKSDENEWVVPYYDAEGVGLTYVYPARAHL